MERLANAPGRRQRKQVVFEQPSYVAEEQEEKKKASLEKEVNGGAERGGFWEICRRRPE